MGGGHLVLAEAMMSLLLACDVAASNAFVPVGSANSAGRLSRLRMQAMGSPAIAEINRRDVVKLGVAGIFLPTIHEKPAAARDSGGGQEQADVEALRQRLQGDIGGLRQGGLDKKVGFGAVKQVLYPEWMAGTWQGEKCNPLLECDSYSLSM